MAFTFIDVHFPEKRKRRKEIRRRWKRLDSYAILLKQLSFSKIKILFISSSPSLPPPTTPTARLNLLSSSYRSIFPKRFPWSTILQISPPFPTQTTAATTATATAHRVRVGTTAVVREGAAETSAGANTANTAEVRGRSESTTVGNGKPSKNHHQQRRKSRRRTSTKLPRK